MAKIIYKNAPQCSGKTAWLCSMAKQEQAAKKSIIYYTSNERRRHAHSFSEKYQYMYNSACSFDVITDPQDIPLDAEVILIDDFMKLPDASQVVHKFEDRDDVTIYVVLEDDGDSINKDNAVTDNSWEQLSLF